MLEGNANVKHKIELLRVLREYYGLNCIKGVLKHSPDALFITLEPPS